MRDRANELLAGREQPLIGQMTPHTLRRTFGSILAEVGVPPRRAMYLLGHTDPTLTTRVYQQVRWPVMMGRMVVGAGWAVVRRRRQRDD